RDEVVALFLALLELLRLGKATVVQEQIYGDILLMPRGRGKDTHAGA
ncbi:MAG: segregation/condensation protein A, partial [Clostridiales bacterium]|nr:segregation/condensation protein A [Clostridiales bacterium]